MHVEIASQPADRPQSGTIKPDTDGLHRIANTTKPDRVADIVFVHGLGGSSHQTWRHGKDRKAGHFFWPVELGKDLPQCGIWSIGYPAGLTGLGKPGMLIEQRAGSVALTLANAGLGSCPIVFVTHSMGGLIVKSLIVESQTLPDQDRKRIVQATKGIVFCGTPHRGSAMAEAAGKLEVYFGIVGAYLAGFLGWTAGHVIGRLFRVQSHVIEMEANAKPLDFLHDKFVEWQDNRRVPVDTYAENQPLSRLLFLLGALDLGIVVPRASANTGIAKCSVKDVDDDHLSLVKPRDRTHDVYAGVLRFIEKVLAQAPPVVVQPPNPQPITPQPVAAPPSPQEVIIKIDAGSLAKADTPHIPRELPPASYKFFGRQNELTDLTERLRAGRNTAVVGPAGMGKTALAARALQDVVGANASGLAASPFPDGLVFLDLYTWHGRAEPAWNALANKLRGGAFMERQPARERATEACRGRRLLVIIEGGEEADGSEDRATIPELFSVLSPENRWLLLTRLATQAVPADTVDIKEALHPDDAAALLDWLTGKHPLPPQVRSEVLELLEGHPLALTWAGNLLARDDEDPAWLAREWKAADLPTLSDPTQAQHTLKWLFARSVRGLDAPAQQVLAGVALLARAPFPLAAVAAALGDSGSAPEAEKRAHDAVKSLVHRGLLRRAEDQWQFTHVLGYRFARNEESSDPGMRQRLGGWLHKHLAAALQANAGGEAAAPLARPLQHAAALLRSDHDQQLWRPLANYVLYDARERLVALGRLELVKFALRAVEEWNGAVPTREGRRT